MSEIWEDWEEAAPAAIPTGAKLKGPGVNAKSVVLISGQVNLWLYLNGPLTQAFGAARSARLRVSPGGEEVLPMMRLDLGAGDTPVRLIATRGSSAQGGSRLNIRAPRWLPSIDKGPVALRIVAQDATGVTLAFDLEAWKAPAPATAPRPPAATPPPCAQRADRRRADGHRPGPDHHPAAGRLPGRTDPRRRLDDRRRGENPGGGQRHGQRLARREWRGRDQAGARLRP